MNPYPYVYEATKGNRSLLSLCCGIGLELGGLETDNVTAVDLAPQYLEQVQMRCPQAKIICSDALEFVKSQDNNSYDVVSIIDGIEHMDKATGEKLLIEMKRIARREILLFTPQGPHKSGYLKNEPHNAWGIEGADHFQTHKSGWTSAELKRYGFQEMQRTKDVSQHGEPYTALMMRWTHV